MNYILKPSLEHIALVKIVTVLWNQGDVRTLMAKILFPLHLRDKSDALRKMEDRVTEKVLQLSLPELLKEKVLGFIKPIGLEIFNWIKNHYRYPYQLALIQSDLVHLPTEFSWTPQGTIDRKKTAKALIKYNNLNISECYKLACIYCLEDDVKELWNKMPGYLRESFSYQDSLNKDHQQKLVFLWTCDMKQEKWNTVDFSYKSIFKSCALVDNKVAAEYFLQKLTSMEKEESLVNVVKQVNDDDILCFLLSQLKEEQQMEVFKSRPREVLHLFLYWPMQSLFVDMLNHTCNFLSKEDYDCLLKTIIHKINYGYRDWDYKNLFMELWEKCPQVLKQFNTDEFDYGRLLSLLHQLKDKETVKLILKDATFTAKKRVIYSDLMHCVCKLLIIDQKWDFLEFLIRECLQSEDEMIKFKEKFEKRVTDQDVKHYLSRNENKWNQLFHLPDDSVCIDKRSVEYDESSSSKRFHSLQ